MANRTATLFSFFPLLLLAGLLGLSACAPKAITSTGSATMAPATVQSIVAPSPDPRVGLGAGLFDAEEALWNLRVVSSTPPSEAFIGVTNSDLAFKDNYAIQGNYNGIQVWDISNPSRPTLVTEYVCPASQSDVSVYGDLLFVSGEGTSGRLDCGSEGVAEPVSDDRLRGIRIFDIRDIRNPDYISNVQTCRGSHTHSLLKDPDDDENVYIYVSGSAPVRPADELSGCSGASPGEDPNSALFRIEVIKVPLAHPEDAAIVSSPRIFEDLVAPPQHGLSAADIQALEDAKAAGAFVVEFFGQERVLPDRFVTPMLAGFMTERGGGEATAADSAAFREALPAIVAARFGPPQDDDEDHGPAPGPTQCHDITLYPEIGLAGGACGGYGLLLDISDPTNPKRMDAVADSNFSYWHSATFSNDGTKVLFTDEWGGGGQPKCRETDPKEWGADAFFALENGKMIFKSYYKLPAPQTSEENCVAHNGSLIPIPGREVMVQSWYQGGISIFDWTDLSHPVEIAYHDRGPVDATRMANGGTWSVYWYNGVIVSSEIARGLDIFELLPSEAMSANEIAAAKSVRLDYLNTQGQPKFVWPASFALAGAYVDQLERTRGLSASRIAAIRGELASAEAASGSARREALTAISSDLEGEAHDSPKVRMLEEAVRDLAATR
jgi:LVIVD repeat-containing protein